jgi:hypothetical protein
MKIAEQSPASKSTELRQTNWQGREHQKVPNELARPRTPKVPNELARPRTPKAANEPAGPQTAKSAERTARFKPRATSAADLCVLCGEISVIVYLIQGDLS